MTRLSGYDQNVRCQQNLIKFSRAKRQPHLYRLLDFASHTPVHDVPDPFYSDNFDYVYRLVEDGCRGLLGTIRRNERL